MEDRFEAVRNRFARTMNERISGMGYGDLEKEIEDLRGNYSSYNDTSQSKIPVTGNSFHGSNAKRRTARTNDGVSARRGKARKEMGRAESSGRRDTTGRRTGSPSPKPTIPISPLGRGS